MQKLILICWIIFVSLSVDAAEWEQQLDRYFKEHSTTYYTKLRFYTYLYSAQYDAQSFPCDVHDYLAERLAVYFFSDFSAKPRCAWNPQVAGCGEAILQPYLERLFQEEQNSCCFHPKCGPIPEDVSYVAHWIPWIEPLPQASPPPALEDKQAWKEQMQELKKIRRNLTERQKEIATTSIDWRSIANTYMERQNVPQEIVYLVRKVLLRSLYDGVIAEMDAKYTYCVPRPYDVDPAIDLLLPKLQTPSYPSGHSVAGAIFSGIMTFFFQNDARCWQMLNEEVSNGRLWAGIHFPEDITAGHLLGRKIVMQSLHAFSIENDRHSNAQVELLQTASQSR